MKKQIRKKKITVKDYIYRSLITSVFYFMHRYFKNNSSELYISYQTRVKKWYVEGNFINEQD